VAPPEEPDAWEIADDEDADALRAFSLMDPRVLADLIEESVVEEMSSDEAIVTAKYKISSLPGLPEDYVRYLEAGGLEREVEIHMTLQDVLEVSQLDLYPRHSDRISARFEQ
jgi:hypothetical protein